MQPQLNHYVPVGKLPRVLNVLQKRRVDLDEDDKKVMRKVVDTVHAERRDELEPIAGPEDWRHRLMTIHDPL